MKSSKTIIKSALLLLRWNKSAESRLSSLQTRGKATIIHADESILAT